MKAIETEYNGYKFRSRLEAKWAIFFEELGVKYVYEPEGFDLDGIKYLPDFFIPELDSYIEIKPIYPTEQETEKMERLVSFTKKDGFIFFGEPIAVDQFPESPESAICLSAFIDYDGNEQVGWDCGYWWCQCPHCGKLGIQFNGRADRIKCPCPRSPHGDKGYNSDTPLIKNAVLKATRHRFW